ncbi:hypothetical protein [Desulfoplanes sp.]
MQTSEDIFAQAMDLGEREMGCLRDKDFERAHSLARERRGLMERLFAAYSTDSGLRDKLERLQIQQRHLTGQARELQGLLKKEIVRVRSQNKRYGGYRNAATVTPMSSRFVNKRG